MLPGDAHCGKEVEIWTDGIRAEGFYGVLYAEYEGGMGEGEFRE